MNAQNEAGVYSGSLVSAAEEDYHRRHNTDKPRERVTGKGQGKKGQRFYASPCARFPVKLIKTEN